MKKQSIIKLMIRLTETAVFIALAVVLSTVKIYKLPLGGSVTLVSMLPICILSFRYGVKWGFFSSFIYSLFQLMFGITMDGILGWGLTPVMLVGCILFDYIIAFTVLGIAGIFKKKGEAGLYAGLSLAFLLRFVSHFISGYFIFSYLDQWNIFGSTFENAPLLYSVCYNATFMLPELVITMAAVVALMRFTAVKKLILNNKAEK